MKRSKAARIKSQQLAAQKAAQARQAALAEPKFQSMLSDLLENTMANLLQEVLHGEFDLTQPPKQYTFAAGALDLEASASP